MHAPTAARDSASAQWLAAEVRLHTPALVRVAHREGLAAADALDAVQAAFVTALGRAASSVGPPVVSRGLMIAIVRNTARNHRRRHHRARPHVELEAWVAAELPSSAELFAEAERHAALVGCVERLRELERQVVRLRVLEALSPAEVSARLAIPPGHVAVVLHRAKHGLRRCLTG